MRRAVTSLAFALLLASAARPSWAQSGAGNLADSLQKEGQAQISQAKKYTGKSARAGSYMSGPRAAMNYGSADATGRFDMSGHTPPGYFRLRDKPTNFSTRAYDSVLGRRGVARSNYSPRSSRPSSSRDIPPAPR